MKVIQFAKVLISIISFGLLTSVTRAETIHQRTDVIKLSRVISGSYRLQGLGTSHT